MPDENPEIDKVIMLPNGHVLLRKRNDVGGFTYFCHQAGVPMEIWNTALTDPSTLLAAIVDQEHVFQHSFRAIVNDAAKRIMDRADD